MAGAGEKVMKAAMQAYVDGFNRADPAAVAALFADDATIEDPVGSPLKTGKAEISKFYEFSMKTGARLKLAAPIRGSHGNSAAMAFDVELKMPEGQAVIRVIDVMTFNEAGQFTSMRAFWGPGDMEVIGGKK
ncbi:steroid Delta-isomerase [Solimonas terrae]|nr:steroid Delta-isomerase [Solimonas terrae]